MMALILAKWLAFGAGIGVGYHVVRGLIWLMQSACALALPQHRRWAQDVWALLRERKTPRRLALFYAVREARYSLLA